MSTVTIRARVEEKISKDGVGFPESVHVTGGQFLSRNAVQEIAQEAVDSMYGEYESGYVTVVNIDRWLEYQNAGADKGFTIPVVRI